jgi:hypothetical protein
MAKRLKTVVLMTMVLAIAGGLPALAQARGAGRVSKPKLSATPVMGVPLTASGVITPKSTARSRAVVKIKLYTRTDGRWEVTGTYRAKLTPIVGGPGTAYSRTLTIPMEGKHAVRAFRYRAGRLVKTSAATSFEVAQRITIDSMVNGWMAPSLGDTTAPANTPLDIVFTTPSDWASDDPAKRYGAAHFIWGGFEKVGADGLIWHTDGLRPGRYDWMRDAMPKWGTGSLVVAQRIDVDKTSHDDTHALPYLPADISFGDVSSAGMGCDPSIAFITRVFARTSPDPLVWHTDGLVPARYDWKCWMDGCHYGTLVADPAAPVTIASDPDETTTAVPANTPLDITFTGGASSMMCWRTMYFTTAGDFTKTSGYPDPLTWRTGGLAPGAYEWQCWMGPQCHHGTVVAQ